MVAVATTLGESCRWGEAERSSAAAASAAPDSVGAIGIGGLIAYGRGTSREVSLGLAAMAALDRACSSDERNLVLLGASPEHLAQEGAAAAALPLTFYRQLVGRVDSLLVAGDTVPAGVREDGAALFRRMAPRYDSQRVQRVVLRSRLSAERARVVPARRRGPC